MSRGSLSQSQGNISTTNRATLISIAPFPIDEYKPGLIPGQFHVDPSVDGRPVCQIIGDSFFYVYIDADRGNLKVPAPCHTIAESICFDYNSAQIEARENCHPGFFWEPGTWSPDRVEKELAEKLEHFKSIQYFWFGELVKRADDDWEKTRQHYAISDTQRYALRAIDPENRQQRPWILARKEDQMQELPTQVCPACASDIPESAIICKYCRAIIDAEEYAKMEFAGAPRGMDLSKLTGR